MGLYHNYWSAATYVYAVQNAFPDNNADVKLNLFNLNSSDGDLGSGCCSWYRPTGALI